MLCQIRAKAGGESVFVITSICKKLYQQQLALQGSRVEFELPKAVKNIHWISRMVISDSTYICACARSVTFIHDADMKEQKCYAT